MKTFYNVVDQLKFFAQRKRMLRSCWILSERNVSCKIVKNCRILGLNRARKNKFCSRSVWLKRHTGIVLFSPDLTYKNTDKSIYLKDWFLSPRFTCKVNLWNTNLFWNTKNQARLFCILAFSLDRGMQRVNWLQPRTIVCYTQNHILEISP